MRLEFVVEQLGPAQNQPRKKNQDRKGDQQQIAGDPESYNDKRFLPGLWHDLDYFANETEANNHQQFSMQPMATI